MTTYTVNLLFYDNKNNEYKATINTTDAFIDIDDIFFKKDLLNVSISKLINFSLKAKNVTKPTFIEEKDLFDSVDDIIDSKTSKLNKDQKIIESYSLNQQLRDLFFASTELFDQKGNSLDGKNKISDCTTAFHQDSQEYNFIISKRPNTY